MADSHLRQSKKKENHGKAGSCSKIYGVLFGLQGGFGAFESATIISDHNGVLRGVFFGKKKLRNFTADLICWLGKIGAQISNYQTQRWSKFGFASYLGGTVQAYKGLRRRPGRPLVADSCYAYMMSGG